MYSLIALFAGIAAKLYDDLEDNNFLQKFRNNTLMEFLKGIHYILFMSLSIEEPLVFIIQYVTHILHSFGNKESYNKPYEHSLLYSLLLLFFIVDYKKIISLCLLDKLIIIVLILTAALEPLISPALKDEYSFAKLISRVIVLIFQIILCYFIRSDGLKYLTIEFIGYLFISVLVQCYSLYSLRMEQEEKEEVKEEKEEKEKSDINVSLTADKDSDGNGNFSNDNVNVGIRPDVKSNNILIQFCSCSLVFSCFNKTP